MLKRIGPLTRFILAMVAPLVLLTGTAALWWWLPGIPRATLGSSGRGPCNLIQIAPNGQSLVAVHKDTLAFWDLTGRRELGVTSFRGHLRLLFSPDGQTLVIAENKGLGKPIFDAVRLWRAASQPEPADLPGMYNFVDFTPDSRFLAAWGDQTYKLWNVATLRERPFPAPFSDPKGVCPLTDGRIVVSNPRNEAGWLIDHLSIQLWIFTAELKPVSGPIELSGASEPVTLSPDDRLCTAWHLGREPSHLIKLYELNTGRELGSIPGTRHRYRPEFSPDGTRLITDDENVWDITTMPPRKVGSLQGSGFTFSPDGKWILGGPSILSSIQWSVFLDSATLQQQFIKIGADELNFAPDSQTIAGKGMVMPSRFHEWLAGWIPGLPKVQPFEAFQVWHFPAWEPVATFANATCCAYLPDGKRIAVGRDDGTIDIWDLPPRRPWWIDFGLPILFVLFLLLGMRLLWRAFRHGRDNPPASGQRTLPEPG